MELLLLVSALLLVSVSLNLFLLYRRKIQQPAQSTQEARDLLRDMLNGSAIIEIKLIDKSRFYLRSPHV